MKSCSRARFQIGLRLAYLWAQHGLGAEEDVLPQRDLDWSNALLYVDEAYESLRDKSKSAPRFECTDAAMNLRIRDTYAYVKLAALAYDLKTQRIPPDQVQVRELRRVLEQALAEARDAHRRLETALAKVRDAYRRQERPSLAPGEAAAFCFTEAETKAWVKRITSHLKLAEALQP